MSNHRRINVQNRHIPKLLVMSRRAVFLATSFLSEWHLSRSSRQPGELRPPKIFLREEVRRSTNLMCQESGESPSHLTAWRSFWRMSANQRCERQVILVAHGMATGLRHSPRASADLAETASMRFKIGSEEVVPSIIDIWGCDHLVQKQKWLINGKEGAGVRHTNSVSRDPLPSKPFN